MRVPNLSQQVAIVNPDGTPTNWFVQWWGNSLSQLVSVTGQTAAQDLSPPVTIAMSFEDYPPPLSSMVLDSDYQPPLTYGSGASDLGQGPTL